MSLSFLLDIPEDISLSALKLIKLKKSIIKRLTLSGEATIAELCKETDFSVPTVTKIISELIEEDIVFETGKIGTAGGRRPSQYGINPNACYYLGVEVKRNSINIGIQDFNNNFVKLSENITYTLENTRESLASLCSIINRFVADSEVPREKIIGACINLSGRINSRKGFSYSYFFFEDKPLSEIIESQINIKTFLENDTRAMTYGEYNCGAVQNEKDVLFVNIGMGVGIGIICNGKLYYGKSGYSGEFGHSPVFENEIICHCGKKGCLETEISGIALERKFKKSLQEGSISILSGKKAVDDITLDDILSAVTENEDTLAIEIIDEIGSKMGRYLSMLINIFNPELVILGGALAETDMYLRLPVRTSIHKYSLSLVSLDMDLKISALGSKAGIIGACYILRDKLFHSA
ncbi:MAG: ROK family transcriptional regulator [Prolixibacteraceae bacterium]|nr:ROK family transcriptional regulator [Prolixibacteraceae bacterium]